MRSKLIIFSLAVLLGLSACRTVPGGPGRPRKPMPPEIAARFIKPSEAPQVQIIKTRKLDQMQQIRGEFQIADGLSVPFEYFQPDQTGSETKPKMAFALVLPYLQGSYFFPRLICKNLARHGIASAYLERPGDVLHPGQKAEDLEKMICATVVRYRAFLDWVSERPEVDPEKLGLVGMSMGSFVGTVLMASDARLKKAVLVLPGCEVSELLIHSNEIKILDYMRCRKEKDCLTSEQICDEFRKGFYSDPAQLASYVDSDGLLLISARYDKVIPKVYADRIWDLLGRPTRIWLPTGHGTAGFCLPYIETKIVKHFQSNWKTTTLATLPPE